MVAEARSRRILVVGLASRVPWLEYTARALQRLGHRTTLFRYTNIWVNRLGSPAAARVAQWVPRFSAWSASFQQRWRRTRDEALINLARTVRPELVIVLRGETIAEEALAAVKAVALGPLVTWWLDDPERYQLRLERWQLFDHVFLFDRACVRDLEQLPLHGPVHYLPCACDETAYAPRMLTRRERQRYACDIALVGWYYASRADVVRQLGRVFPVDIWGPGWTSREARRRLGGSPRAVVRSRSYVSASRAATIYSAATISLNVHHAQSRDAGLNMRTFELLAAGALQLVNRVPGMEELLVPNEEVAVFASPEEACGRADFYLRHPQERTRVASRGRSRALREHTYVNRMQTLLRAIDA